jgi:serine O-acetyltransferase
MNCDYSLEYILELLERQLGIFLLEKEEKEAIEVHLPQTLERTSECFKHSQNKYYFRNGQTYFNPFHSGQWCIFLYFLSNTIFKSGAHPKHLCDKVYLLNKMLNSCDLFYEVKMPDIFFLDHPQGSVIGRATIKNYFSFSQGCTVGNNKGIYPVIGEHVTMLSDSKIIGNSNIGNNVTLAANTFIKDQHVPDNTIVFGTSPNLTFKAKIK